MVPFKRPAGDKSGVPVYQPAGATTYQQLMQLQQPFVPVSCEYAGTSPLPANVVQSNNSNQTIVTNHSIQNAANSAAAAAAAAAVALENGNGILVDPNNPPPPPTSSSATCSNSVVDKHNNNNTNNNNNNNNGNSNANSNDSDATLSQNSHDLNHRSSPHHQHLSNSVLGLTSVAVSNTGTPSVMHYSLASGMPNHLNVLGGLGMAASHGVPPGYGLDAANLAKEVAQKNYAKALKLSQNNAAAAAYAAQQGIGSLNAFNYTGMTLNKQALGLSNAAQVNLAAAAAASANQRAVLPTLGGIPGGAGLAAHLPAGLLAYGRPGATGASVSPYSFIRQQVMPGHPYLSHAHSIQGAASVQTAPIVPNPYAMMSGVSQLSNSGPTTIASAPQVAIQANSTVIVQPYKKMKTT